MEQKLFGTLTGGSPVWEFVLENQNFRVEVITYGGILKRYQAFGMDTVTGFDTLEGYLRDDTYQGALVGRVANRIKNGHFVLDGKGYQLALNSGEGRVHLHGGFMGFSRKNWEVVNILDNAVTLRTVSQDGDQHYPGTLTCDVTYSLGPDGLTIDYRAETDAPTPVNLTNHAYFNLDGCKGDSILDYVLWLGANRYSAVDEDVIPCDDPRVDGTIFDFRTPHTIGKYMEGFAGYDHNYFLDASIPSHANGMDIPLVATMENDKLKLSVYTDQPCIQLYIGNFLDRNNPTRGGIKQAPHTTVCLEAQILPDSVNRGKGILRPGEIYRQTTVYGFTKK